MSNSSCGLMAFTCENTPSTRVSHRPSGASDRFRGRDPHRAHANIWIYLVADLLGAAAAVYTFLYVLPAEKPTGDVVSRRVPNNRVPNRLKSCAGSIPAVSTFLARPL